MKPLLSIVAAAETRDRWAFPDTSVVELHRRAVIEALDLAGLKPSDVDGLACGTASPQLIASSLGIDARWIDGTSVPNCSSIIQLRHAEAAIQAGQASVVVIVHAESLRSLVGVEAIRTPPDPSSLLGQFEAPFGANAPGRFALALVRYMHEFGVSPEMLAQVPVVGRQWAALTPGAAYRQPLTVEAVLESPYTAYPLHRLECGATTDSAGAIVVTSAAQATELTDRPVFLLGAGEAYESPLPTQHENLIAPVSLARSAEQAMHDAAIGPDDVDHAMVFDGFAHGLYFGLESLGVCPTGQAPEFVSEGATAPDGALPTNTNGGFLSYRHGEMAQLQEAIRQLRGEASAQLRDAHVSVVQGAGPMFSAGATAVLGTEPAV